MTLIVMNVNVLYVRVYACVVCARCLKIGGVWNLRKESANGCAEHACGHMWRNVMLAGCSRERQDTHLPALKSRVCLFWWMSHQHMFSFSLQLFTAQAFALLLVKCYPALPDFLGITVALGRELGVPESEEERAIIMEHSGAYTSDGCGCLNWPFDHICASFQSSAKRNRVLSGIGICSWEKFLASLYIVSLYVSSLSLPV